MTLPKFVTYNEIMLVYGLSTSAAQHKLQFIRRHLNKKRFQNILIQEFCQAENIEVDLFLSELKKEMEKIHEKKYVQINMFN